MGIQHIQPRSTSPRGGTEELLHKYDLDVFVDVVKAIKEANREGSDGKWWNVIENYEKTDRMMVCLMVNFSTCLPSDSQVLAGT
jgi:hypothetical protein